MESLIVFLVYAFKGTNIKNPIQEPEVVIFSPNYILKLLDYLKQIVLIMTFSTYQAQLV